jgi:hypothetical protein
MTQHEWATLKRAHLAARDHLSHGHSKMAIYRKDDGRFYSIPFDWPARCHNDELVLFLYRPNLERL